MAIMVLGLIMNLVPDPQRSEGEKLVIGPMLSQYPPMIGHTAKAIREIPHHLTRITLLIADTIKTKLLPAITPTCHHQSIRHLRSLREELSYVETKARGDEAVTLAVETSRHDGKLVVMVDPSKGNRLGMTTARTAAATNIKIALHSTMMTKGKAPEAIVVAEIHRRMSRERGVTPHHPRQEAHMAVAVAVQPGHVAPERIRRITSPTTHVPT
jgi:hypothetical protein